MGRKEELLEELRRLEVMQSNCKHEWPKEAIYVPYQKQVMEFVQVPQGSDIWTEQRGTGIWETIPRWKKVCPLCGKEDYTETLKDEVLLSIKVPDFKG